MVSEEDAHEGYDDDMVSLHLWTEQTTVGDVMIIIITIIIAGKLQAFLIKYKNYHNNDNIYFPQGYVKIILIFDCFKLPICSL